MKNNKFNAVKGALDLVDESIESEKNDRYEADIKNAAVQLEEEKEEKFVRSYSLTKKQLQLLQKRKLEEVDKSLSDIVGEAIEYYLDK